MARVFANCEDPDQTPCSVASDLDLHCLPITLLGSPNYNGLICTPRKRLEKYEQLLNKTTLIIQTAEIE